MTGLPIGGALVSIFATLFMERLGWQSLFYVGGITPLVLAPLVFLLPNTRGQRKTNGQLPVLNALSGDGRLWTTIVVCLLYLVTMTVSYLMLNWLPSLITARGFGVQQGHEASLVFNAASAAGILVTGFFVDRFGYMRIIPLAYSGLLAAICFLSFTNSLEAILISAGFLGFFILGAQNALNGICPMFYPPAARGVAVGAAIGVGRCGSILGPLYAGFMLQAGLSPVMVTFSAAPLILCAAVLLFLMARNQGASSTVA